MAVTIPMLLRYLRTDTEKREVDLQTDLKLNMIHELRNERDQLRVRLAGLSASSEGIDTAKVLSEFREEVTKSVADKTRAALGKEADEQKPGRTCKAIFVEDQSRLLDQLSTLRRRGNLNLAIGVTTTLGAILVLILTVYSVRGVQPHSPELIAYFVPRISTVVFVEVFSFFFLRLYKTTLEEEKYYQSEITSRSSLRIAFEAAVEFDQKELLPKVLDALSAKNKLGILRAESPNAQFDLKELGALVEAASKVIVTVAKSKSGAE